MKNETRITVRKLLMILKPHTPQLILSVCAAAVFVVASLLIPVLSGRAVDTLVGVKNVDGARLVHILVQMLSAMGTAALAQLLMARLNNHIVCRVNRTLRRRTFSAMIDLPIGKIDSHAHGDFKSRIVADCDAVCDGLLLGFSQLFTGLLTIAGTIFFLFKVSLFLAPVVVALTPLSIWVARFISGRTYRYFAEQAADRAKVTDFTDEHITQQKLLHRLGAAEDAKAEFAPLNEKLVESSLKATFFSSLPNPSSRFVNNLIYAAVGILGALLAVSGKMSVGSLASFLGYAREYAKPFNEITGVIAEMQNALACAGRIFELIAEPAEKDEGRTRLKRAKGDIVLDHVSFRYDPEIPLIEDLNLTVKRGMHIAIVGPTGSGKTTLVNLLMRFYDTQSGTVTVDGTDVREIPKADLRQSFGMVLQETFLFSGTVRENLTIANPYAADGEIEKAARLTHAHDFISKLPDGYDTDLSADGASLSAGQKQLLCITRLMLALPPMLILDEATSSIDTRTEQRIAGAFDKMMRGRTTFIVAHRLSTIVSSDLILYMEDGTVKEQGTHSELLARNGLYAIMYRTLS